MSEAFVLDASALIALMDSEPGQERVAAVLPGALMSAVNLAEVASKLADRGLPPARAAILTRALGVEVVPFDDVLAEIAGELRQPTRRAGLSLGDRACLALARRRNAVALTADGQWPGVADEIGIVVRDIRPRSA